MLKPLGDRILIKPEVPPDTTESGLHLVQYYKPEHSGEVVAVGECVHPLRDVAEDLATRLGNLATSSSETLNGLVSDAQMMLRELVVREPSVKVGDFVVFSADSGQELKMDGERFVLMREADILAVVEGEPA